MDEPRPLASRAERLVPACADLTVAVLAGGDLLPFCPDPPPPPPPAFGLLTSLNALAPKLMRLAKGVVGWLPEAGSRAESSSTADSSIEPLFAELMLSRRAPR